MEYSDIFCKWNPHSAPSCCICELVVADYYTVIVLLWAHYVVLDERIVPAINWRRTGEDEEAARNRNSELIVSVEWMIDDGARSRLILKPRLFARPM